MQQQISVVTLGVADLHRSKRFYIDGFGWKPVFQNEDIVFYQMNGFVLGTWSQQALEADMQRTGLSGREPLRWRTMLLLRRRSRSCWTGLLERAGEYCATAMLRLMAGFAATSPIRMITLGKLRGIPPGGST